MQLRKSGVKVKKGQKTIDALRSSVPHWIHKEVKDDTYIGGVRYLRACTCSSCGYESNQEKPVCPNCGAKMSQW
jgi:rubrerythrin